MRIAILSRKPSLYSTQRLQEAGQRRGHDVEVIDYLRCYMNIGSAEPTIFYQGRDLRHLDAVIPRIGSSHACYGGAVVRQFELLGVFAANSAEAIGRSHDKLRILQVLAQRQIPLPATAFVNSSKGLRSQLEQVGGVPVVVKLLNGSPSAGAILAETRQAAESVVEAFEGLDANSMVQHFVREAAGKSLRCLVVGGRVVAAMIRTAPAGEFRSNLHRGGSAERVKPSPQERRSAVSAAHAMGLEIAGIDILRSDHGPLVIAVNSSPELEGIETATEVDVAAKIFEFLEGRLAPRNARVKEALKEAEPLVPAMGL